MSLLRGLPSFNASSRDNLSWALPGISHIGVLDGKSDFEGGRRQVPRRQSDCGLPPGKKATTLAMVVIGLPSPRATLACDEMKDCWPAVTRGSGSISLVDHYLSAWPSNFLQLVHRFLPSCPCSCSHIPSLSCVSHEQIDVPLQSLVNEPLHLFWLFHTHDI